MVQISEMKLWREKKYLIKVKIKTATIQCVVPKLLLVVWRYGWCAVVYNVAFIKNW